MNHPSGGRDVSSQFLATNNRLIRVGVPRGGFHSVDLASGETQVRSVSLEKKCWIPTKTDLVKQTCHSEKGKKLVCLFFLVHLRS